jgi:tetratricopeptide (TPR) repeat protein
MMSHEHENHEGAHAHDHAEPVASTIYSKLYNEVKVTKDSHLKPEEEKEVLPWFYVETAFNPHDIRGYVMGAYWLERMGKNEESLKFLRDGEKNNPDSAQIYSALGEYYFKMKNYDEAIKYLEKSCALWTEGRGVNAALDQYSQSDRLFAFDLSASLYMHNKDYAKAIRVYNEALKFGPNPAILEKLKKARSAAKGLNDNN